MTAVMISEMNSRSPRVVGIRRMPTRSASGYRIASQVITASVAASSAKKSAVGGVQAIHAMFSMALVLPPNHDDGRPPLHPTRVYPSWASQIIEVGYIRLRLGEGW